MAAATGTIVAAAIAGGAAVYGAHKQTSAAKASAKSQNQALDKTLEWEREQEARRQEEWERSERANAERWSAETSREQGNIEADRNESIFRDRRLDPYREAGREAVADLTARRKSSMADLLPTGRI